MTDIFLSYSREDEARIKDLVSELEAQGWSVFWDRRIPVGETWRSHIGAALQNARCVVVAWSKHSVESDWVAEEADDGKQRKCLFPVLLDPVLPPRGFREIQAADISDWGAGHPSPRFDELLADLRRVLGKQADTTTEAHRPQRPTPAEPAVVATTGGSSLFGTRTVKAILTGVALCVAAYVGFSAMPSRHTAVDPQPVVVKPERDMDARRSVGVWLIVAGSFSRARRPAAENRRNELAQAGIDATVIDSSDYPLLKPDLWVVSVGRFNSGESANATLARVKDTVPDAYVKKGK